ncbi:tRNA (adenine(58)-N(1))-methyltransferase non-catalytic subunit TRM6 [Plodia interpunctella]|uniref:tRNA (adenine(58)-N(1))-methyltransferase non-catalytic subunit TRM6 n=1 Tax=Plodia interpunctella TaxID=58824 RepID=UPI002368CE2E|nr:tRNA (adenine(58)-N(1))-methyltransferase non-catalytic subunit TRM6 [Plodia interpunctella]
MNDDTIKIGDYLIIQKQNYRKLHKFTKPNSSINLGRDSVNLSGIEGCPYFSVFKMISLGGKRNKEYILERTDAAVNLKDEIDVKVSGNDNRNILDDGRSQKLSAAEIEELKCDAVKASDIVETLITNSNTFHNKTEFSQEKYLKKKEKKYFEYLQVVRPNLRLITEVMYRLDPGKIQGIRIDTLSQIMTLSNIQSEGVHLLYDSGSNGLVAAALLSAIGANTNGKLVHMHPGNMSQKQGLLAMNFSEEHLCRCISVNVYSVLRQFHQGCDVNVSIDLADSNYEKNKLKRKAPNDNKDINEPKNKMQKVENGDEKSTENINISNSSDLQIEPKKPKWHFDNITASDLLKEKVDSLIITCKEDPLSIFKELVEFVKPGRPFVVYYPVVEPLLQLYLTLRSYSNVAALKITCNWMRNYQVLPERTHPEVTMNCSSGFLLTGYVLK